MTRVVAGVAGGRRLTVPGQGTRPTSERVREALFSSLESRMDLEGAAVLDLFAGSGALGLEALSRGASTAVLIESDSRAASVVRRNIEAVGLPGASVVCAPVASVLAGTADAAYDLVLADPPYAITDAAVASLLARLVGGGWLATDAIVVLERSSRSPETDWPDGLMVEKSKKYGESRIEIAVAAGVEPAERPE